MNGLDHQQAPLDGFLQVRQNDWFIEHPIRFRSPRFFHLVRRCRSRQHQNHRGFEFLVFDQGVNKPIAAHVAQIGIHHHEPVGDSLGLRALDLAQCLFAQTDHGRLEPERFEHFRKGDSRFRALVCHDHHPHVGVALRFALEDFDLRFGLGLLLVFIGRNHGRRQIERKRAPLAQFAADPDVAAHFFHQARHDSQAEARPAKTARHRTVHLGKGLENDPQLVFRNADSGVDDFKEQIGALVACENHAHAHVDGSVLGKLEGIAQQVHQHLPQAGRVSNDFRWNLRENLEV